MKLQHCFLLHVYCVTKNLFSTRPGCDSRDKEGLCSESGCWLLFQWSVCVQGGRLQGEKAVLSVRKLQIIAARCHLGLFLPSSSRCQMVLDVSLCRVLFLIIYRQKKKGRMNFAKTAQGFYFLFCSICLCFWWPICSALDGSTDRLLHGNRDWLGHEDSEGTTGGKVLLDLQDSKRSLGAGRMACACRWDSWKAQLPNLQHLYLTSCELL